MPASDAVPSRPLLSTIHHYGISNFKLSLPSAELIQLRRKRSGRLL